MNIKETFAKKKIAKLFTAESEMTYTFKNELGSIMKMEIPYGGGLITGTYTSGVSDPNTYPLTGYVVGNCVTFTVGYTNEGSTCAWAGQAIYNTDGLWEIPTLWHLVVPNVDEETWDDTYAGSDLFVQVK